MIPKVVLAVGVLPGADPVHAACCCYLEVHFVTGMCFFSAASGVACWGKNLRRTARDSGSRLESGLFIRFQTCYKSPSVFIRLGW